MNVGDSDLGSNEGSCPENDGMEKIKIGAKIASGTRRASDAETRTL